MEEREKQCLWPGRTFYRFLQPAAGEQQQERAGKNDITESRF